MSEQTRGPDLSQKQKISRKQELLELSEKDYLEWPSKLLDDIAILRTDMAFFIHPTTPAPARMHCQFQEHVCKSRRVRNTDDDCDRPYLLCGPRH